MSKRKVLKVNFYNQCYEVSAGPIDASHTKRSRYYRPVYLFSPTFNIQGVQETFETNWKKHNIWWTSATWAAFKRFGPKKKKMTRWHCMNKEENICWTYIHNLCNLLILNNYLFQASTFLWMPFGQKLWRT